MDGLKLCEEIKTNPKLSHIPIVLLTAKNQEGDRLAGFQTGADDYLSKPFKMKELIVRIQNLIDNRNKLRDKYNKDLSIPAKELVLNSYDEQLMEKIESIITNQMDKSDLNVDNLGEQVGMSRVHLYRKLKAITGLSPSDLIKRMRLKTAAQMIQQNKINITEIAYRVEFQDQHYFSKCFKKQFGMSPTEYKQQNFNIQENSD